MAVPIKSGFVSIGLASAIFLGASEPAHSACAALPNIDWWQSNPTQVSKFVDRRHKGDWAAYIAKWAKYSSRMQGLLERRGSAVVNSKNLLLEGDDLKKYVLAIDQRVSVLRCLASSTKNAKPGQNAKLPTVPRGSELVLLTDPSGKTPVFPVEVRPRCDGKNIIFEVKNHGKNWPAVASIGVYRTQGVGLVKKQVAALSSDKTMTLKISPEPGRATGQLALWLQPSWFLRDFKFDARLSCN